MASPNPYDTFLSASDEWHAFVFGVYYGFRSWADPMPPVPDNPDVVDEPHYYRGGYLVGKVAPLGVIWALNRLDYDHDLFEQHHCPNCPCG